MELKEVIELLKEHEFTYVDIIEDPSILDDYYTVGQLMYHLKEPLDILVMFEALQGMGIIRSYEGHQIPNNMDYTVFTTQKDDEGNDKILILYRPSFLSEFVDMLNESEHFVENMKQENRKQLNLLNNSNKIVSVAIDTIGGSFKKNKIINVSLVRFENGTETEKVLWVDNNWSQDDIDIYTTPKYEGKKSNFEYLNLPLPGMQGSNNHPFINIKDVLRTIYGYTNGACLIIDNKTTLTLIKNLFIAGGVDESHHIDGVISGYIELSRIAKEQKSEYMTMKDMLESYNVNVKTNFYASGKSLQLMAITKKMLSFRENINQ
jgi:hypothetical protein